MRRKRPGIGRVFLLFAVIALIGYLLFFRQVHPVKHARRLGPARQKPVPSAPVSASPEPQAAPAPPAPGPAYRAKVAIIIDDMGQDLNALDEVLHLDAPVAVAVLPMLVHSQETSRRAHEAGRDVLLHLPMQPRGESLKGLGRGALMEGMAEDDLRRTLSSDLATVPGATGVNNHMGSALTEDKEEMMLLMAVLRERGMYFVDSRTSPKSVAYASAVEKGVKAASRRVFLDDSEEPEKIKEQLEKLERLALRDGSAIAIGHPKAGTLGVLRDELPRLKGQGIEVVRVSSLVGEDRTFLSDAKAAQAPRILSSSGPSAPQGGKYQKKAMP